MASLSSFRLLLSVVWYCIQSFVNTCVYFFVPLSLRRRKSLQGEIALVTGGGNGLGRSLAIRLAAEAGATVVVWDVDGEGARRTARAIRERGGQARAYQVDVARPSDVYASAHALRRELGPVGVLVHNAAVANYAPMLDCPDEVIAKVMGVNALSHFWLYKAFLPAMKAKNSGHIVTVASVIAYIPERHMVPYSASKSAVVGIHEAVQLDLAFERSAIKMTLACPVAMDTNMIRGRINTGDTEVMSPDDVADAVVEGVLLEQPVVFYPRSLYISSLIKSLIPVKVLVLLFRALNVAETFLQDGQQPYAGTSTNGAPTEGEPIKGAPAEDAPAEDAPNEVDDANRDGDKE